MSTIKTAAGVVLGGAAVTAGLVWLYLRLKDRSGSGFGLGLGGGGGDKLLGKHPASGPADEPGGTGGSADKPGDTNDAGGGTSKPSASGGGGSKPTDKSGTGSGGHASGGGSKPGGDGHGGSGGGLGGGSGGGVGIGEGEGTSGNEGDGGAQGEQDGGGESSEGPYDAWGGVLIAEDLAAPDLSEAKLAAVRETVLELVGSSVLETPLPPPLHAYDPNLGGVLLFWADVALHMNYKLPPGRLDPNKESHGPWLKLWRGILEYTAKAELEINGPLEQELEQAVVGFSRYAMAARGRLPRSIDARVLGLRGPRVTIRRLLADERFIQRDPSVRETELDRLTVNRVTADRGA